MSIPESYLNRESFNNLLSDSKSMKATELNDKYITGNYSGITSYSVDSNGNLERYTVENKRDLTDSISSSSNANSYSSVNSSSSYLGNTGMSGTLSMSEATYARSLAGMKKLSSLFQSEIDSAINYLGGSEYSTMINTISKYWVGPDADQFRDVIHNMLESDKQLFKSYKSIVQSALDSDYNYFNKSQENIASAIKGVQ